MVSETKRSSAWLQFSCAETGLVVSTALGKRLTHATGFAASRHPFCCWRCGWYSSESASRFALIGSAQAVARRGFLLIVSLHNLMHTPYRLRQTCNDLRRL